MNTPTTARGAAVAAAVLSLVLAGCGSDSSTDSESSAAETTTSSSAESSGGATETGTAAPEPGANLTIAQYIQDNGITEAKVNRGDEGAPTINLPSPPG